MHLSQSAMESTYIFNLRLRGTTINATDCHYIMHIYIYIYIYIKSREKGSVDISRLINEIRKIKTFEKNVVTNDTKKLVIYNKK